MPKHRNLIKIKKLLDKLTLEEKENLHTVLGQWLKHNAICSYEKLKKKFEEAGKPTFDVIDFIRLGKTPRYGLKTKYYSDKFSKYYYQAENKLITLHKLYEIYKEYELKEPEFIEAYKVGWADSNEARRLEDDSEISNNIEWD